LILSVTKRCRVVKPDKQTAHCHQGIALRTLRRCFNPMSHVGTHAHSQVYGSESNWTMKATSTKRSEIKQKGRHCPHSGDARRRKTDAARTLQSLSMKGSLHWMLIPMLVLSTRLRVLRLYNCLLRTLNALHLPWLTRRMRPSLFEISAIATPPSHLSGATLHRPNATLE